MVTAAGCGADEESSADPAAQGARADDPRDRQPATALRDRDDADHGDHADRATTSTPAQPTTPSDTPENDTPPPADSPAERFEQFCNDNPGACG